MNSFDKVWTASIPEKPTAPFTPNFNKNGPAIFLFPRIAYLANTG
jgi:hypothetical protein